MLTLAALSDRIEIQDLLVRYAYAIDFQEWDKLDCVFVPDALIDYSAFNGPIGDLASTKAFLRKAWIRVAASQHMVSTSLVELAGDSATARTICHNPMVWSGGEPGKCAATIYALWYLDELVRTPTGWRIAVRRELKSHVISATEGTPPSG